MQELVEWTQKTLAEKKYHPLLIVGNFIVEFLQIHPFQDGNGRLSRILTNLLLLKEGYLYMPYISHEKLVEDNKPEYYLALRKSQKTFKTKNEDLTPWLDFFLTMFLKQSEMAIDLLSKENIERLQNKIENLKYIEYKINKGKGYALRKGVEAANSQLQIFTDIDFPYTAASVAHIYEELNNGNDISLGYRIPAYYKQVPLFRKLLSKLLRWVLKKILKLSITDTQCGLKGFNQRGREVFLQTKINRFLFDLEFVLMASRNKSLKIKPVLVELREGITFSKVNLKVLFVESLNFLMLVFKKKDNRPLA